MIDPFNANRQFERFLFQGVPEYAESTWERDYYSIVTERATGKSLSVSSSSFQEEEEHQVLNEIIIDNDLNIEIR